MVSQGLARNQKVHFLVLFFTDVKKILFFTMQDKQNNIFTDFI